MRGEGGKVRVAFQGESGAFSEAAAVQLLGEEITTIPRPTFDAAFQAMADGSADVLVVPVENSLAGSVVRVYDLLLESKLTITAETVVPIEHHLIACPGASLRELRAVSSHPMALAQCERFFAAHPHLKRVPAEDTAGSVREVLERGDKAHAAIAGRRAAERYHGVILCESIQDNAENFTRFLLLRPSDKSSMPLGTSSQATKMTVAMRIAHRPGALLAALEAFARFGINLLKIESRPIHGRPWVYQFFVDVEADAPARLENALNDLQKVSEEIRVLGFYPAAQTGLPR